MERKIGEIFEHEGEWYQCVEGRGCKSCGFYEKGQQCKAVYYAVGSCGTSRSDKRPVIFKKLEKVGEPFKELNHSTNKYVFLQEYKLFDPHAFLVDKVYAEHCFGLYGRNSFFIEIN